jgi:hypothetical protein
VLLWLAIKTAIACLICGLCYGQQNAPPSETYASFFGQIARWKSGTPVLLNGHDTGIRLPSVQQTVGLTDEEVAILRPLAVACTAKIRSFDEGSRKAIFEANLEITDAGSMQARARQALKDIEDRRHQIVRSCVDDLRVKLGDVRFEVVQTYIRSRQNLDFLPPVSK